MYNSPYPMPGIAPQGVNYQQQTVQQPQMVTSMPSRVVMNSNAPMLLQQQQQMAMPQPTQIANTGLGISFGSLADGSAELMPVTTTVVTEVDSGAKKRGRKKKTDGEPINHSEEVNQVVYADTYESTNHLLHQTIGQIDILAGELKEEMDKVMSSRAMKGRHMALGNISKPLSDLIATKVQVIKELNNSIKAVNDMEYRRAKDNRAFESVQGDDKAIMDLYNAFISAPVSAGVPSTGKYSLLGPNMYDAMFAANETAAVNDVVAANGAIVSQSPEDSVLSNYMGNLTPEQNAMLHEGKVEVAVVYDKATGQKAFQAVDIITKQPVPNIPVPDEMFLKDITVDPIRKVARNTNLNEVYPVILINEGVVNEY